MAVTIARTPWIDDDGTGTTGTVLNNAAKQELYGQIDAALAQVQPTTGGGDLKITGDYYEKNRTTPMGHWITVPYTAGNFTALPPMTWTVEAGDVVSLAYTVIGKTMTMAFYLVQTTTGGTATNELRIALPAGYVLGASQYVLNPIRIYDATTWSTSAVVIALPSAAYLVLRRSDDTNWPIVTNGMYFMGNLTFQIA